MQRNGTSSVGKFFRDFGFRWAGWPTDLKNNWSTSWYDGDFEKIFSSEDFKMANAFEDSPWFFPDFYKVLYNRYPDSKFILFTRNSDAWFNSMVNHSGGDIIGRGRIHCKIYRRELEYFDLLNDGLIDEKVENQILTMKTMKLTNLSAHYKEQYRLYNYEVIDFFQRHDPKVLHIGNLEDLEKWVKLGAFLNIHVPDNYRSHENNSRIQL